MHPVHLKGFHTKTILVRVPQGTETIVLQKSNDLGLPDNLLITGFLVRPHNIDKVTYDNRRLVEATVFENAFLNLHVKNAKTQQVEVMLSQVPLQGIADTGAKMITPTLAGNVDWSSSHIALNKTAVSAVLNSDTVFEMVVLYTSGEADNTPLLYHPINFRTGSYYAGANCLHKQLLLNDNQTKYSLSNTNTFGMPREALVLGFSLEQYSTLLKGKAMNDLSITNGYFSLQQGSTLFIENLPLEMIEYKSLLPFNLDYFPIVPVEAQAINWQSSCINLLDISNVDDDEYFQIRLRWIHPVTQATGSTTIKL